MTPSDIALFWLGIGLIAGLWGSHRLWQVKIQEKAQWGTRLEVRGKLYNVTEDKSVSAGAHNQSGDK